MFSEALDWEDKEGLEMTEIQGLAIAFQLLCIVIMLLVVQSKLQKIIDLLSNKRN